MTITRVKIGDREVQVDTSIADRLIAANNAKVAATGTPITISQSFRTTEQQAELFRKSQAGEIGRAAPPGMSFHETGKAFDVVNVEESQQFLNRYGLRNDLEGDSGHFSIGETQPERFTSFAESVEKGRQRGFTDTELLDVFISKNPTQKKAIDTARQRYNSDSNIKNDRDLTNFLALRYSGIARLETPSVPTTTQREVVEEETGFLERVGERIGERAETIEEKSDLAAQGKISTFSQIVNFASQGVGATFDVLFEGIIELTPDAVKDKVKSIGRDVLDTEIGQKGLEAVQGGIEKFEEFKVEHPEAATNIESLANFAEVIPVERVGALGVRGAKAAAKAAPKVTGEVIEAGAKTGKVVGEKTGVLSKFAISQGTGLAPETIEQIVKNPGKFTDDILKTIDRESLAKGVASKLDERIKALRDTGSVYTTIRNSGAKVDIDANFIQDILKKDFGLNIVDGKIKSTTKSITRNQSDINRIQNVLNDWGDKTSLDADEFLNFRGDLSDLSRFDAASTKASDTVGKGLRNKLNNQFRDQVDGLKELDDAFKVEKRSLDSIKSDFFTKRNEPKPNFINIVANLTGKGKETKLAKLKEIIPDIEEKVKFLKAVENIEAASGIQVGTYARSLFGVGGLLTGNPALILSSILATPKIAVFMLRKYGQFKKIASEVIEKIIEKLKNGTKLNKKEAKIFDDMINEDEATIKKLLK